MEKTFFTIGYAGFLLDDFIKELKKYNIDVVIDVRSFPYSERYPDYNKPAIESALKNVGIYYKNYANEFGARQKNRAFYSSNGYLDFDVFSKSEQFQNGVEKMINSTKKGYTIVFMCAEKEPIQCHRTILVAREFDKLGFSVIHLMPNGITKDQRKIDEELLEKHFPNINQINMFEYQMSDEEYLDAAYKKQNEQIGYHLEENNDNLYDGIYSKEFRDFF